MKHEGSLVLTRAGLIATPISASLAGGTALALFPQPEGGLWGRSLHSQVFPGRGGRPRPLRIAKAEPHVARMTAKKSKALQGYLAHKKQHPPRTLQ